MSVKALAACSAGDAQAATGSEETAMSREASKAGNLPSCGSTPSSGKEPQRRARPRDVGGPDWLAPRGGGRGRLPSRATSWSQRRCVSPGDGGGGVFYWSKPRPPTRGPGPPMTAGPSSCRKEPSGARGQAGAGSRPESSTCVGSGAQGDGANATTPRPFRRRDQQRRAERRGNGVFPRGHLFVEHLERGEPRPDPSHSPDGASNLAFVGDADRPPC